MQRCEPEQDENAAQGVELRALWRLQGATAAGVPSTRCHGSFRVATK